MKKRFSDLKNDIKIILQGLELVKSYLGKTYFPLILTVTTLRLLTPYISIYCTGQILTAFTENKGFKEILTYVLIATVSTFIIDIIIRTANKERLILLNSCYQKHAALISKKGLELDYAKSESSAVQGLRGKIEEHASNGNGLTWLADCFADCIGNLISAAVACVFIFDMFSKTSENSSGINAFINSPLFAVILLIIFIAVIALTVKYHTLSEKREFEAKNNLFNYNPLFKYYNEKYLNENESGKDVRIFNEKALITEEISEKVYAPIAERNNRLFKIWAKQGQIGPIAQGIFGGIVYLFVGLKALSGAFGAGSIVEYYGSITKLFSSCRDISGRMGYLRANNAQLKLELEYFALTSDMNNGTKTVEDIDPKTAVFEFSDVSFTYPETETQILNHLNLKISAGEHLAVVGINGSGKSTMIKLLCRLYDPSEGKITLNGIDIREYDYAEYLKLFGIVFQDFKLLAFPVGENIACSESYDEEKVWKCLEMAGIKERIEELPKKLGQSVYKLYEKDGIDFSGGEEQKLAIARALYKDAPFVILDEPTAALDPIAESEIYSRFNEIAGNKTTVFISHRLSSCRFCDRIVVFDDGKIIQNGTHEELLSDSEGKYSKLWNAQAQYYAQ